MKHNGINDLNIAYIGGGSRNWAWTLMTDLALEPELSGIVKLYDIDNDAALVNEKIGNTLSVRNEVKSRWRYRAVTALKEALSGADFVIISILPGTFDEMEVDVHMPERLGILQPVGDTVGPGGIMRALRAIPMFAEIARAIGEYAPGSWVINYTNPMSLCVKTLYSVFPEVKAFGCCHEVFGTQSVLKAILAESTGISSASREDMHVNVQGINHFTWFDTASYRDIDLFPLYRACIDSHYDEGFREPGNKWADSVFDCSHRVKFDLFRRYGRIAAAGDRHLAEFMPGNIYLKNPETVEHWKFRLTPVSWRKADLAEKRARAARLESGKESLELAPSGEEGIRQIRALCGLEQFVTNVNIPNRFRQIPDLPETAVVETNALFGRNAIRPVAAGSLSPEMLELFLPHVENQETVFRAAMDCDREAVVHAFMNDQLVRNRCSISDVRDLVNDMIAATSAFLPRRWND